MKNTSFTKLALSMVLLLGMAFGANAQMPIGGPGGPGPVISAPGSPAGLGNGPDPAPGSGIYNPGPPDAPAPPPPTPLGNGPLAPMVVIPPLSTPDWQNSGVTTVIACGYDAQSVWRTIPLRISYNYNGAQYNVTVLSAWNPWVDAWNYDIDVPAFNTYYFLNGNYYNFYVNLSTGTFYFNL